MDDTNQTDAVDTQIPPSVQRHEGLSSSDIKFCEHLGILPVGSSEDNETNDEGDEDEDDEDDEDDDGHDNMRWGHAERVPRAMRYEAEVTALFGHHRKYKTLARLWYPFQAPLVGSWLQGAGPERSEDLDYKERAHAATQCITRASRRLHAMEFTGFRIQRAIYKNSSRDPEKSDLAVPTAGGQDDIGRGERKALELACKFQQTRKSRVTENPSGHNPANLPKGWVWEEIFENPLWWLDSDQENRGQIMLVSPRDGNLLFQYNLPWEHLLFLGRASPGVHPTSGSPACQCRMNFEFLTAFASPRPLDRPRCLLPREQSGLRVLKCQFRYFTQVAKTWKTATWNKDAYSWLPGKSTLSFWDRAYRQGIYLERQVAKLGGRSRDVYLSECVISVSLHSRKKTESCQWGITVLTDGRSMNFDHLIAEGDEVWANQETLQPNVGADELAFQGVLVRLFLQTIEEWNKTLDTMQIIVGVTLGDFCNDEHIESLMFDETFERSKEHFTALQLLRLIDDWVNLNVEEIKYVREQTRAASRVHVERYRADADEYSSLLQIVEHQSSKLQRRVSSIREEITALRDGLRNAAFPQETSRSTLFRLIVSLVFTLAAFWAFACFYSPPKAEDGSVQPINLLLIMLLTSYTTYLLSEFSTWYLWPSKLDELKLKRWKRLFDRLYSDAEYWCWARSREFDQVCSEIGEYLARPFHWLRGLWR